MNIEPKLPLGCLIVVCCLTMFPRYSFAQGCAVTLDKHFSTYRTMSIVDNTISQTVRIEGYATISPGPGCPMEQRCTYPQGLQQAWLGRWIVFRNPKLRELLLFLFKHSADRRRSGCSLCDGH